MEQQFITHFSNCVFHNVYIIFFSPLFSTFSHPNESTIRIPVEINSGANVFSRFTSHTANGDSKSHLNVVKVSHLVLSSCPLSPAKYLNECKTEDAMEMRRWREPANISRSEQRETEWIVQIDN